MEQSNPLTGEATCSIENESMHETKSLKQSTFDKKNTLYESSQDDINSSFFDSQRYLKQETYDRKYVKFDSMKSENEHQ